MLKNTARIMTVITSIGVLSAAPAWAAVTPPEVGQVRFRPPGYPFSVALPEAPVKSRRSTSTVIGSVYTDVWITPGASYSIAITDLPGIALWFNDADDLFEKARDQMLEELGADAVELRTIARGPFEEALDYRMPATADAPPQLGRAYFALLDDKLVVVTALAPRGERRALDRHFASLRVER